MKHIQFGINFIFFFLVGMQCSLWCADVGTMLWVGRTDIQDPSTVKSANMDNKKVIDTQYPLIFTNAPRLETLSLQHHLLVSPTPGYAQYLHALDLSHGTLKEFPLFAHLAQMKLLTALNLSHNKLMTLEKGDDTKVNDGFFSQQLKKLNVSHNKLSVLNMHMLDNLTGLQEADFSYNDITKVVVIPKPKMPTCPRFMSRSVTKLLLDHNSLSQTDKNALKVCEFDIAPRYKEDLSAFGSNCCMGGFFVCGITAGFAGNLIFIPSLSLPVFERVGIILGITTAGLLGVGFLCGTLGCVIGRGIATCKTPHNKRYAQVFNFVCDAEDEALSESVSLDVLQEDELHV